MTYLLVTNFSALDNYFVEQRNVSINPVHRKRFRDRNRYLQMTPVQRETYLQRNREYKRAKRENYAISSSAQSITGQRNMSCSDHIHKLMNSSQVAEGTLLWFMINIILVTITCAW